MADILNYSRLLPLQRVEVGLQGLQKTFWGLWSNEERVNQRRQTHYQGLGLVREADNANYTYTDSRTQGTTQSNKNTGKWIIFII